MALPVTLDYGDGVKLPLVWRALHALILINFLVEMAYAAWMIFFVVTPGVSGALGTTAAQLPFEAMTTRRLYAVEFWIATAGFSIYLAITEILPRRVLALRHSGNSAGRNAG